jgi:hypothetical protein
MWHWDQSPNNRPFIRGMQEFVINTNIPQIIVSILFYSPRKWPPPPQVILSTSKCFKMTPYAIKKIPQKIFFPHMKKMVDPPLFTQKLWRTLHSVQTSNRLQVIQCYFETSVPIILQFLSELN